MLLLIMVVVLVVIVLSIDYSEAGPLPSSTLIAMVIHRGDHNGRENDACESDSIG